jgi:CobQ-like glutamine amidotransferase family enzyme
MEPSGDRGEEHVVDLVVEVESRGVDVDALARRVVLPGIEVLRTSGTGMIWLTALVTAADPQAAIQRVQDALADQIDAGRVVVATAATSVPLGELYARLDSALTERQLEGLDLFDLVQATLWSRPGDPVHDRDGRQVGSTA